MNRRNALKYAFGSVGAILTGSYALKEPMLCGWVDDIEATENFIKDTKYPFLSQLNSGIKGTGKNKIALLHRFFEQITCKPLEPHVQTIGDCVAQSYGLGVDILTAVQILLRKRPERWLTKCATEIIYAGARVEIAKGKLRGDGCNGIWAAKFIKEYGILLRQKYLKYDFTTYSGPKARKLGKKGVGVPDDLEPLCKLHPVKTFTIVRSWEECRDAVANGYPVTITGRVGFNRTRDKNGFLKKSRNSWNHSMLIAGIDDNFKRPGALIINSWGKDWVSGPTRHNQPAGSFWCDAKVIDKVMKQGASVALSNYKGYPRVNLHDYFIY